MCFLRLRSTIAALSTAHSSHSNSRGFLRYLRSLKFVFQQLKKNDGIFRIRSTESLSLLFQQPKTCTSRFLFSVNICLHFALHFCHSHGEWRGSSSSTSTLSFDEIKFAFFPPHIACLDRERTNERTQKGDYFVLFAMKTITLICIHVLIDFSMNAQVSWNDEWRKCEWIFDFTKTKRSASREYWIKVPLASRYHKFHSNLVSLQYYASILARLVSDSIR